MRRIETWVSIQVLYMPAVVSLRARAVVADPETVPKPQEFPLWLPSAIHREVPCDTRLEEIESKLQFGQAHDALEELRQALRSRTYMLIDFCVDKVLIPVLATASSPSMQR